MLRICTIFLLCLRFISPLPEIDYKFNSRNTYQLRQKKALEMQSYLNTSVDACVNFYEYSSGNYGKHFKEFIESYTQWSPMYNVVHLMEQKIALHLNTTNAYDSVVDKKVKQFYRACLNKPSEKSEFTEKLKALVQEFGQMPILEDKFWSESDFNWAQVVAQINAKTDIGIIMHAQMSPDPFNNSINRATLLQPQFLLPTKIYYESETFATNREDIRLQIQNNLEEFLNINQKLAQETSKEILDFEIALAHGMQNLDYDKPDVLYNLTNIVDLQYQYLPAWNTMEHFATVLDLYPSMIMTQPTYLKNLFEVIQKTPKKQVANYVFYIYLNEYMKNMGLTCEATARNVFPQYFENTMYHKHTTEDYRLYVQFMWQEIRSAYEDTLNSSKVDWLSDNTRQSALEKLKAMELVIDSYEDINFEEKYNSLQLNDYNFLDNYKAILMLRGSEGRAKVTQPPKFLDPPVDNLVYASDRNVIHFPVAYLLPGTLWSPHLPAAINFGSIATFIGHEMVHGFDDLGRHFDKLGNYHNWWDYISSENFEGRKECIKNQYKNYKFKGANLPALENQCENISDNVGVQQAYKAYMNWYRSTSPPNRGNEIILRLNYNNKQLFFLAFAQSMGGALAESFVYDNDTHLPGEYRVKGTLSNMIEFAEAFNCRRGSIMNPARKCGVY